MSSKRLTKGLRERKWYKLNDTRILGTFAWAKRMHALSVKTFQWVWMYGRAAQSIFRSSYCTELTAHELRQLRTIDWSFTKQNLTTHKVEKFEISVYRVFKQTRTWFRSSIQRRLGVRTYPAPKVSKVVYRYALETEERVISYQGLSKSLNGTDKTTMRTCLTNPFTRFYLHSIVIKVVFSPGGPPDSYNPMSHQRRILVYDYGSVNRSTHCAINSDVSFHYNNNRFPSFSLSFRVQRTLTSITRTQKFSGSYNLIINNIYQHSSMAGPEISMKTKDMREFDWLMQTSQCQQLWLNAPKEDRGRNLSEDRNWERIYKGPRKMTNGMKELMEPGNPPASCIWW